MIGVFELEHPLPLKKVIKPAKKSLIRICLAVVSGEEDVSLSMRYHHLRLRRGCF